MKTAVVAGALGGIGRAIAEILQGDGYCVLACDLAESAGDARFDDYAELDVVDEAAWARVAAMAQERFEKVDAFVNAAGVDFMSNIADFSLEELRRVHAINAEGGALGLKALLPLLSKSDHGAAVMISSISGSRAEAYGLAYAASKAALEAMVKSAALYCGKRKVGVRVNAIAPGFIETEMFNRFLNNTGDAEGMRAAAIKKLPAGRIGAPQDIAAAALFLLGAGAAYITGQTIVVDGGASLL